MYTHIFVYLYMYINTNTYLLLFIPYFLFSFQAELAQQNACERFEHMSARAKEGMVRNQFRFLNCLKIPKNALY